MHFFSKKMPDTTRNQFNVNEFMGLHEHPFCEFGPQPTAVSSVQI